MRRRDFIKVIAGSAIAWPLTARAQQATKIHTIGYLSPGPAAFGSMGRVSLICSSVPLATSIKS
jgi:hypothetical protein